MLIMADDVPVAPVECLSAPIERSLVVLHPVGSPLTAVISPRGGELVGLQIERDGRRVELLHRGMNFCPTKAFAGKAPILWPAAGRNYADDPAVAGGEAAFGWRWRGQRYPMPLHGFARDMPWRVVGVTRSAGVDSVSLRLVDTAETRAQYPFRFAFTITYRLKGRSLTIDHRIVAGPNAAPMPFSIGNHITFALPLAGRGSAAEAVVSTEPTMRVVLDTFGRPANRRRQPPLVQVPVETLGKEAALPLAGYRRGAATATLEQPGSGSIGFSHWASMQPNEDPVRYNLWGNAAAGFFSVEPWLALQNSLGSGKGVISLQPRRSFRWTVALSVDL